MNRCQLLKCHSSKSPVPQLWLGQFWWSHKLQTGPAPDWQNAFLSLFSLAAGHWKWANRSLHRPPWVRAKGIWTLSKPMTEMLKAGSRIQRWNYTRQTSPFFSSLPFSEDCNDHCEIVLILTYVCHYRTVCTFICCHSRWKLNVRSCELSGVFLQ